MKKGQTESYSFLIGIIITILLLTGVGCAVYQIYKPKGKESFDRFIETLKDLENKGIDDDGDIPIYVEEDEILLGFSKEQEYIGRKGWTSIFNWNCYGIVFAWGIYTPFGLTGSIDRPIEKCPEGKSCLCLCKMSLKKKVKQDACEAYDVRCEVFSELDFIGGEGCPQGVFIPGTKYSAGGTYARELGTVYYSKKGSIVSIDDEAPKTKEEIETILEKEKQDASKEVASEVFIDTVKKFEKCLTEEGKECNCDTINISDMPEGYKIRLTLINVFGPTEDVHLSLFDPEDKEIKVEGYTEQKKYKIKTPFQEICFLDVNENVDCSTKLEISKEKIKFTEGERKELKLENNNIYLAKKSDKNLYLASVKQRNLPFCS